MVTLMKLILIFSFTLTVDYLESHMPSEKYVAIPITSGEAMFKSDNHRKKTFEILKNKCNVCQRKQNRRLVFSTENKTHSSEY